MTVTTLSRMRRAAQSRRSARSRRSFNAASAPLSSLPWTLPASQAIAGARAATCAARRGDVWGFRRIPAGSLCGLDVLRRADDGVTGPAAPDQRPRARRSAPACSLRPPDGCIASTGRCVPLARRSPCRSHRWVREVAGTDRLREGLHGALPAPSAEEMPPDGVPTKAGTMSASAAAVAMAVGRMRDSSRKPTTGLLRPTLVLTDNGPSPNLW